MNSTSVNVKKEDRNVKSVKLSEAFVPFLISFSFLKTLPVSAAMKASPFSHRLSTDTPGLAASMTVFKATEEKGTEVSH